MSFENNFSSPKQRFSFGGKWTIFNTCGKLSDFVIKIARKVNFLPNEKLKWLKNDFS